MCWKTRKVHLRAIRLPNHLVLDRGGGGGDKAHKTSLLMHCLSMPGSVLQYNFLGIKLEGKSSLMVRAREPKRDLKVGEAAS